ncbi:MAG: pyruvate kinase [Chitinophagales bacterium]
MKIPINKVKMIATFGPAISTPEVYHQLVMSGVDVIRFNFSHGSYDDHKKGFELVKQTNETLDAKVAILADLQGPKIRLGDINGEIELQRGDIIDVCDTECVCTNKILYINYLDLHNEMHKGERILINDGRVELKVEEIKGDVIKAKVINGGKLTSRKGVNLPDTNLTVPALTPKDKQDLNFALENGANWIALSFVRTAHDIEEIAKIIGDKRSHTKIIAKIEKPEALKNIKDIVKATDGIMVARGDLGVEIPLEQVPLAQKKIIQRCIKAAKPVIVATQMMESMIENPVATRAEVNDVANAVIDGADAVMLSAETSVGKYPVKVVQTIQHIFKQCRKD